MVRKSNTCALYIPLNEGTGTPHDSSGYGNSITNHGATWVNGSYGRAMAFNGTDQSFDCGNDVRLQPTDQFGIGLWVLPAANQEYCYDGSKGNYGIAGSCDGADTTTYWSWQLRYGSSVDCTLGLQVNSAVGSKWVEVGSNLSTTDWSYVFAYFTPTLEKILVNGIVKDTNNYATTTINTNVANKIFLGVAGWGTSNTYYEGKISDFRFYKVLPTDAEILSYFNTTKGRYGL